MVGGVSLLRGYSVLRLLELSRHMDQDLQRLEFQNGCYLLKHLSATTYHELRMDEKCLSARRLSRTFNLKVARCNTSLR